jgi:hypothetical protein
MSWNPATSSLNFLGGAHCGSGENCPGAMVMLEYSDAANAWTRQSLTGTHTYESTTINTSTGTANKFYHLVYNGSTVETYDIASQSWVANLPDAPFVGQDCCNALEYFPDRNSLIAIENDWGIYEYSFASGNWSSCLFNTAVSCGANNSIPLCATSSTSAPWARYDALHHRMLLGGCSNVYAMSPTLGVSQLASSPVDVSAAPSGSPVTTDPATGKLVTFDPSTGDTLTSNGSGWVNAGSSPFDPMNGGLACAPISTYNVVMCVYGGTTGQVTNGTVWLYKATSP